MAQNQPTGSITAGGNHEEENISSSAPLLSRWRSAMENGTTPPNVSLGPESPQVRNTQFELHSLPPSPRPYQAFETVDFQEDRRGRDPLSTTECLDCGSFRLQHCCHFTEHYKPQAPNLPTYKVCVDCTKTYRLFLKLKPCREMQQSSLSTAWDHFKLRVRCTGLVCICQDVPRRSHGWNAFLTGKTATLFYAFNVALFVVYIAFLLELCLLIWTLVATTYSSASIALIIALLITLVVGIISQSFDCFYLSNVDNYRQYLVLQPSDSPEALLQVVPSRANQGMTPGQPFLVPVPPPE